jgi:hypothetical protein
MKYQFSFFSSSARIGFGEYLLLIRPVILRNYARILPFYQEAKYSKSFRNVGEFLIDYVEPFLSALYSSQSPP